MPLSIQVKKQTQQGPSGSSGFSGGRGDSGFSGINGAYSASGYSGASGQSGLGFSGPSGPSGVSGFSGLSGIGASAFGSASIVWKTLDETQTRLLPSGHQSSPPPIVYPPVYVYPDSELNILLQANHYYNWKAYMAVRTLDYPYGSSFPCSWCYSGDAEFFDGSTSYVQGEDTYGLIFNLNEVPVSPNHGEPLIAPTFEYPINMVYTGYIKTITSGVFSLNWGAWANLIPYPRTVEVTIKAGAYIIIEDVNGAASGCSGFSGKTGVVMTGSWLGI